MIWQRNGSKSRNKDSEVPRLHFALQNSARDDRIKNLRAKILSMAAPFSFTLPDELSAKEPPERRGLGRDKVRLLVIDRESGAVRHAKFERLAEFLRKGDLLVFNSSRTLPASLEACCSAHGPCLQVRLAQHLPDDTWLALLVCKAGDPFGCGLRAGMQ